MGRINEPPDFLQKNLPIILHTHNELQVTS